MAFLNQFSTYFTAQERETELYQLWSTIGANMEKSILEELNSINANLTDINNFSEDTLRSWLAFFLQKIPYRTSATVQLTVSMPGEYAQTTIPQYSELTTSDGITYTQMSEIVLLQGDSRTVTAVQGTRVVEEGTYSNIIKVQATNPDLSYLTVKIDGVEIPEVSYETSYDQLKYIGSWKPELEDGKTFGGTPFLQNEYGEKGSFYTVIDNGTAKFAEDGNDIEFRLGDIVVFDGLQWQRSSSNNNLTPVQFANSFAVPRNGYFAYYYNDYLYIKIFQGSDVSNPAGRKYEVSYIQSDGIQGEVSKNSLFYISSFEDINENVVELEVSNTVSSAGVNQPSRGKLGIYLKQRMFTSINVSSVPEYTHWFNAQPEVGDSLVLSDYERYIRSGKTSYDITGIVDVYLVDPNGKEIDDSTGDILLERLEPYKDVAVVRIRNFTKVYQYLKFEYISTNNQDAFEQYVKTTAALFYDLSYLQSTDSSIFGDLDLSSVTKKILDDSIYSSTGLILKGYHYFEQTFSSYTTSFTCSSYGGERAGNGYYIFTMINADGEEEVHRFEEIELAGSTTSCQIWDVTPSQPLEIGTNIDKYISLNFANLPFQSATLQCYWAMENEGILTVGSEDGMRVLAGIDIEKKES